MAAGKTTAANYLKEKYGAVTYRFSDMLRDVLVRLHLPLNRGNMQTLSTILRQNYGEDLMSKVLTADLQAASEPIIIAEGIRRPSDIIYLKQLPGFNLLYLKTSERARFERLAARSENPDDGKKTWEQFQAEGLQESEQKIKEIAAEARIIIDNNGTVEQLNNQLDALIKNYAR